LEGASQVSGADVAEATAHDDAEDRATAAKRTE
jgi:hypothetical protein